MVKTKNVFGLTQDQILTQKKLLKLHSALFVDTKPSDEKRISNIPFHLSPISFYGKYHNYGPKLSIDDQLEESREFFNIECLLKKKKKKAKVLCILSNGKDTQNLRRLGNQKKF